MESAFTPNAAHRKPKTGSLADSPHTEHEMPAWVAARIVISTRRSTDGFVG